MCIQQFQIITPRSAHTRTRVCMLEKPAIFVSLIKFSEITNDLSKMPTHDLHMCFKGCGGCHGVLPRSILQDWSLIPPASGSVGSQYFQQSPPRLALAEEGLRSDFALSARQCQSIKAQPPYTNLGVFLAPKLLLDWTYASVVTTLQFNFSPVLLPLPPPTGVDPESFTPQNSACLQIFISESVSQKLQLETYSALVKRWARESSWGWSLVTPLSSCVPLSSLLFKYLFHQLFFFK